jgi:peptide/nickel transport system substrate-binding protein
VLKLEQMQSLATAGKMSRREFVQLALATGIALGAAETMFETAAGAAPKHGGSGRFGLVHGSTTDTLDPAGYPDTATQIPFWGAMANSLTEVDYKGNITPDLVESMEPSDGAKTWVFKLLRG